jgi:hypothetical protein
MERLTPDVRGAIFGGLKGARNLALPYEVPGYRHVVHRYVSETRRPEHRDLLLKFLNQESYPWGRPARIAGPIPNSERNAASCISLSIFPELMQNEIDFVIEKTLEWDGNGRRGPPTWPYGTEPGTARVRTPQERQAPPDPSLRHLPDSSLTVTRAQISDSFRTGDCIRVTILKRPKW